LATEIHHIEIPAPLNPVEAPIAVDFGAKDFYSSLRAIHLVNQGRRGTQRKQAKSGITLLFSSLIDT
jgi:hypothetical protein